MNTVAWIVFFASAAGILYVLAGYPLLLALMARVSPRPVRKDFIEKSVTVLLPVHNGGAFLESKLESLLALDYPPDLMEILVLSDGSTDSSDAVALRFAHRRVRLLRLPRNGKSQALNRGIAEAHNEILLLTDVRQPLERDGLRRLMECFADPDIGVVSGDLIIRNSNRQDEADIGLYRRYESWIRARLSQSRSVIGATGCFYAMRRNLARELPPHTLLDDVYLPMCAISRGFRCILEPAARCYDYPTALDTEFRRKVRTQAGVYQLMGYFPELLLPWSATGFHFLSLKLGRLLLPFLFLGLLISSFGITTPWREIALAGQGCFYILAVLDGPLPDGSPLKKLTSPIRSFVVLVISALCAVSIFFVHPRDLWKETRVNRAGAAS